MKIAATICYAAGTLIMFGTQTVFPNGLIVPGYLAVFLLFVAGLYLTFSAED